MIASTLAPILGPNGTVNARPADHSGGYWVAIQPLPLQEQGSPHPPNPALRPYPSHVAPTPAVRLPRQHLPLPRR